MDGHGIIAWLVIGAIAGWLAGMLVKGGGFGLIGDIIVGIIGAVLGGWLAGLVGLHIGSVRRKPRSGRMASLLRILEM